MIVILRHIFLYPLRLAAQIPQIAVLTIGLYIALLTTKLLPTFHLYEAGMLVVLLLFLDVIIDWLRHTRDRLFQRSCLNLKKTDIKKRFDELADGVGIPHVSLYERYDNPESLDAYARYNSVFIQGFQNIPSNVKDFILGHELGHSVKQEWLSAHLINRLIKVERTLLRFLVPWGLFSGFLRYVVMVISVAVIIGASTSHIFIDIIYCLL